MNDVKKQPIVRHAISFHEHQKLLNYATGFYRWPWWEYACRLGWDTGFWLSDVALLQWENIRFDEGIIIFTPQKTRRLNRQVIIPMLKQLENYLREMQDNPRCYWHRDNPLVAPEMACIYNSKDRTLLCKQFKTICARAGVWDGHSFSGYRHGFFSRLMDANAPLPVIASMTGASLATIMPYAGITIGAKRATLEEMRALLEQVRPKPVPTAPPLFVVSV